MLITDESAPKLVIWFACCHMEMVSVGGGRKREHCLVGSKGGCVSSHNHVPSTLPLCVFTYLQQEREK